MRIGNYTITNRPIPGWTVPARQGRVSINPTLGGVVAQAYSGHPGDELAALRWEVLLAHPARTLLLSYSNDNASQTILAGERYAFYIPGTGVFAAASACRASLRRFAPVAGYLRAEIWGRVAGAPTEKLGGIGYVNVEDISTAANEVMPFWGLSAYPIDPTTGCFLVISADDMTGAGSIRWAGQAVACTSYLYSAGVWAAVNTLRPAFGLWQGDAYNILRGLAGQRNRAGGTGPEQYDLDLEDGELYTGFIAEVEGVPAVYPQTAVGATVTSPPATVGVFEKITMSLGIAEE